MNPQQKVKDLLIKCFPTAKLINVFWSNQCEGGEFSINVVDESFKESSLLERH